MLAASGGVEGLGGLVSPSCRNLLARVIAFARLDYSDRIEARYQFARSQVNKLTPSLLAKAFRGELVPQDPNDEPAGVLLKRIKAKYAANTDY